MPFLRLTRDRRGTENTFLMHADRPGDRARLLYWYRTAPGITLGRPPLDEDAIRAIEDQYPDIDFDWPAILALSEVMTPEDEAAPRQQSREGREPRDARRERRPRPRDERPPAAEPRRHEPVDASPGAAQESEDAPEAEAAIEPDAVAPRAEPLRDSGLVDQLAGREIASRLRGRYAEMLMRIRDAEASVRDALMPRAEQLDPDRWDTPEAVLRGVSTADAIFEQLRAALASPQ